MDMPLSFCILLGQTQRMFNKAFQLPRHGTSSRVTECVHLYCCDKLGKWLKPASTYMIMVNYANLHNINDLSLTGLKTQHVSP